MNQLRMIVSTLWRTQRTVILTTVTLLGVGLLVVFGLETVRENRHAKLGASTIREETLSDPILEGRVRRLAANFACVACGICGGLPLEDCQCLYAIRARNLIRRDLAASRKDLTIIADVQNEFGGLEPPSGSRTDDIPEK